MRSLLPGNAYYLAPRVVTEVRRTGAGVIHAHNYHPFPALFGALGVIDKRFVLTSHYHDMSASGVRDQLLRLYGPLGWWVIRRADAVVAVSGWERDRFCSAFGVDATHVPNGVERGHFANATPEVRERPYLLCVGRLESYKSVQHAIRALPGVPERELVVVGTGPYRETFEAVALVTGVTNRVTFAGYVDDARLPDPYAGAAVHFQLDFESYGMTVAESLCSGTPVVVHETGALTDWVDVRGAVGIRNVHPGNVAAAVKAALCGPAPESQSIPDWGEIIDDLVALYAGDC